MGKKSREMIEKLLNEYDKSTEKTAIEILNEIKLESKTYGEIKRKINRFEQSIIYEYQDRYDLLMKKVKELLGKEMNDLPLTNRSEQ